MKKIILALALCLTTLNIFAQNEKDSINSEAFELVDVWLDAQKDYNKIPAIMVAVVRDQEIQWKGAYGKANLEKNVEAETNTLCSICSISKLFTAVAIMNLVEEGKLRLDDNIADLLPWFDLKQQYQDSWPITVRALLTHSSGLPREANFPYWTGPDFPFPAKEQIIEQLKEQETLYPSSTYFQYSNLGLTLLGYVIEEVTGAPFDDYIKSTILDPLNLQETRTSLPEDLYGGQLAIGYTPLSRTGERDRVNFFQANGIKPAAGFSSNVEDLSKFASWQFRLLDSSRTEILNSSTLKYMQNVHWTDPDWETTWGLGFAVYKGPDGSKWISHGGSCPGYRTLIQLNPKTKMAYVVMINAGGENPAKYAAGIRSILEEKSPGKNTSIDKERLKDYTGFYDLSPWSTEMYVTSWGDKLVSMNLSSDNPGRTLEFFRHIEGDTFRRLRDDEELGEEVSFDRDENGNVYRLKQHNNYSNKIKR